MTTIIVCVVTIFITMFRFVSSQLFMLKYSQIHHIIYNLTLLIMKMVFIFENLKCMLVKFSLNRLIILTLNIRLNEKFNFSLSKIKCNKKIKYNI